MHPDTSPLLSSWWRFVAPPFLALCFLIAPAEARAGTCPQTKLFSFHKIKESKVVSAVNTTQDSSAVRIEIPLSNAAADGEITGSLTLQGFSNRIAVRKRLFRFTARAAGLDESNLKIQYLVNNDNKLRSVSDKTSAIDVKVVTRDLDITHKKRFTRVDAYVDLLLDYSNAKKAGTYTGTLEVIVECTT